MIFFDPTQLRGTIRQNIGLSDYTSWRVGGIADWFFEPADQDDLQTFLKQLPADVPILWLGLGSNLLIRDGGLRGVVIRTASALKNYQWLDSQRLRVEVGVTCAKVAKLTTQQQLGGAEFLAGIPGTIGGALFMNAGAWGGDTWTLVEQVETISRTGEITSRSVSDYQPGYRHVQGLKEDDYFIATQLFLESDPEGIGNQRIRKLLQERAEKQPLGLPSCGSVFRNPPNDHAARLIEQAGLKGRWQGGAQVSPKHSNFIINQNNATAADIETLIKFVQKRVLEDSGVQLQTEVKIIGQH